MAELLYLYNLADALLTESLEGLAECKTGRALPCTSYVSVSAPAIDNCCECDGPGGGMLTVHLGGRAEDPVVFVGPDDQCQIATWVNLTVTLARCVPRDPAPTATALDLSAQAHYGDLWALLTHLLRHRRDAGFISTSIPCKQIKMRSVRYLDGGPSGGCAGWEIVLAVAANDPGPPDCVS